MSDAHEGRAVAIGSLCMLTVALVAWLGWTPVDKAAQARDATLLVLTADSVLANIFIIGLEGLLFGLVPLRFLDGAKLSGWSWSWWALFYAVIAFFFVHTVLGPGTDYFANGGPGSVARALAIFVAFGAFSVAFWAYFRYRPTRPPYVTDEAIGGEPSPGGFGKR